MNARILLALAAVAALSCALAESAQAQGPWAYRPWHGNYYHSAYGAPVAVVVPPTAELQTKYQWGVTGTSTSVIRPQFRRRYYGIEGGGQGFYPTPLWPSHTDQFGAYYIRGPW